MQNYVAFFFFLFFFKFVFSFPHFLLCGIALAGSETCLCVQHFFFFSSSHDTRERVSSSAHSSAEASKGSYINVDYDLIFSRLTVCRFAKMAVEDLACYVVVAKLWD